MDLFESLFGFRLQKNKVMEETEKSEKNFLDKIQSLSQDLQKKVFDTYNSLTYSEKVEINSHVGKYDIQGFKNNLSKLSSIFAPFFNIDAKGVGKGEVFPLLTIKGSKTGGTADKDIIVGGSVIEVKELDQAGKFRTGKTGSIRDTELDGNMQTLIKIIRNLRGIPELQQDIEAILEYYDKTYKFGSGKPGFFVNGVKNLVEKLRSVSNNHGDYVKVDGKKYSFTRKDDRTIVLGVELDQNQAALSKIKHHPYYKDLNTLVDDFKKVKERYLESVDYLLLYEKDKPESVALISREEAKTKVLAYDVNQQSIRLMYGRTPVIKI